MRNSPPIQPPQQLRSKQSPPAHCVAVDQARSEPAQGHRSAREGGPSAAIAREHTQDPAPQRTFQQYPNLPAANHHRHSHAPKRRTRSQQSRWQVHPPTMLREPWCRCPAGPAGHGTRHSRGCHHPIFASQRAVRHAELPQGAPLHQRYAQVSNHEGRIVAPRLASLPALLQLPIVHARPPPLHEGQIVAPRLASLPALLQLPIVHARLHPLRPKNARALGHEVEIPLR